MNNGPEALSARMAEAAAHARESGALRPIATRVIHLADAGIDFIIRLVQPGPRPAPPVPRPHPLANPFLPYERDLHIADLSPTHVAILNKYNIFDPHVLIITRDYRPQEEWLAPADFAALLQCMAVFPSMGFYNAGRAAGASQQHKHLQVVPVPLAGGRGPLLPVAPLVTAAGLSPSPGVAPGLPYVHAVARIQPAWFAHPGDGAEAAFRTYRALVHAAGLAEGPWSEGACGPPYNLIVVRDWMLLVPRVRETFYSITVNSLGVAGALLVKDQERLRVLQRRGPAAALRHVTR